MPAAVDLNLAVITSNLSFPDLGKGGSTWYRAKGVAYLALFSMSGVIYSPFGRS
jgi:hypothetical protein